MNKLKNTLRSYLTNMEKDLSKEFLLEFFKHSKIQDQKGVLTISEVPFDFENFVGKRAPYKFVFDFNLHNKVKDSELIMQGSYFLLAIRDYLANKGQTSLLKLNIKTDMAALSKNPKLKNYKILEVNCGDLRFLSEFSFLSTYQYLNEKQQYMHRILTQNKEGLDIDLTKIKTTSGNKDEIPELDLNEAYSAAKKLLNEQVTRETRPIKNALREKLENELKRVKDHYFKQIKEKDEEVERCAEKINLFQSKLKHTFYERDIRILEMKIRESKVQLEVLKKKGYRERLRTEEIFHINDEVEKHVLSIKNNLINTTLYYYTICLLHTTSKGKKLILRYDPLLDIII
jgi:hypothetical protein